MNHDALRQASEIGRHPLALAGLTSRKQDGFILEELRFATATGAPVRGLLTRTEDSGRHPAVLYIHAHGSRYDIGAAEDLARAGVLDILSSDYVPATLLLAAFELPNVASTTTYGLANLLRAA